MTQLGDNLDKGEEIYVDIEAFVCALYGCKGVTNINQLRSSKFKEQNDKEICHVDLKTVPPCRSSLYLHLKRANRAAYMMSNIAQCIRNFFSKIADETTTVALTGLGTHSLRRFRNYLEAISMLKTIRMRDTLRKNVRVKMMMMMMMIMMMMKNTGKHRMGIYLFKVNDRNT